MCLRTCKLDAPCEPAKRIVREVRPSKRTRPKKVSPEEVAERARQEAETAAEKQRRKEERKQFLSRLKAQPKPYFPTTSRYQKGSITLTEGKCNFGLSEKCEDNSSYALKCGHRWCAPCLVSFYKETVGKTKQRWFMCGLRNGSGGGLCDLKLRDLLDFVIPEAYVDAVNEAVGSHSARARTFARSSD